MNLNLNPSLNSQIDSPTSTSESSRSDASAATGVGGAEQLPGDTTSLGQISGLVAKAMDQPEVRMDKVEEIRSQIAAGTYEVDPSKVADAIIKSMS